MGWEDCVQGTEGGHPGPTWAGSVELAHGEEAGRRAQIWTLFSVSEEGVRNTCREMSVVMGCRGLSWRLSSRAGVTSQAQRGGGQRTGFVGEAHRASEWMVHHVVCTRLCLEEPTGSPRDGLCALSCLPATVPANQVTRPGTVAQGLPSYPQVLEDTCRRQDFNPSEYDLK